jgi:FkbM family methyltransferase
MKYYLTDMLFNANQITNALAGVKINGVLHVGAHDCQELGFYNNDLKVQDIVWIDALETKVKQGKLNGHNIYHATISDQDDQDIKFNISNNEQSSSILEFDTHSKQHPGVVFVDSVIQKSITIDTFFKKHDIDCSRYDFWNFDIQGAELLALKGATNSIRFAKVIYLEVNKDHLYKDCALIDEIDAFLSDLNFTRTLTCMTAHGWGDALYLRTD